MTTTASAVLSAAQLATLRQVGEERAAAAGDVLFRAGGRRYPFTAILDGEVAVLDAANREVARHGPAEFLGEVDLLSGQSVYVTAVVTAPVRYIAVERAALRTLLFEDAPLTDVLLAEFVSRREVLQAHRGGGIEVIGPRSSQATRELVAFARSMRLAHVWRDTESGNDPEAARLAAAVAPETLPLVRLPGG